MAKTQVMMAHVFTTTSSFSTTKAISVGNINLGGTYEILRFIPDPAFDSKVESLRILLQSLVDDVGHSSSQLLSVIGEFRVGFRVTEANQV